MKQEQVREWLFGLVAAKPLEQDAVCNVVADIHVWASAFKSERG